MPSQEAGLQDSVEEDTQVSIEQKEHDPSLLGDKVHPKGLDTTMHDLHAQVVACDHSLHPHRAEKDDR